MARYARLFSLFAGALAIIIGGSALVGHLLDLATLRDFLAPNTPIKANSALCFVLLGLAYTVAHWPPRAPGPSGSGARR